MPEPAQLNFGPDDYWSRQVDSKVLGQPWMSLETSQRTFSLPEDAVRDGGQLADRPSVEPSVSHGVVRPVEVLGEQRVRISDLFDDPDSFESFDSHGAASGPPGSTLAEQHLQQHLSRQSMAEQLASGVEDESAEAIGTVVQNTGSGAPTSSIRVADEQTPGEVELGGQDLEFEYVDQYIEPDWLELDAGPAIENGGYAELDDPDPFIF